MEGERSDNVDAPSPSLVGQRVGAYDLVQEVGRGGMATVYVANDARHNRRVALKVLDQRIASALGHDRFLREIPHCSEPNAPEHRSNARLGAGGRATVLRHASGSRRSFARA